MSKIFISYRHDDSAGYAGRLYDRLVKHFGADHLFMDIDQIEPGEDFVDVLQKKLQVVQVAVVLIGKSWLDSKDEIGQRRLDNPDDWVRIEITTLLERKIRIIPVLVGGAATPKSSQLPEPLIPLERRQAFEISDTRFHSDVDKLIHALEKIIQSQIVQSSTKPNSVFPDAAIQDHSKPKVMEVQHDPIKTTSKSDQNNKASGIKKSNVSRSVMIGVSGLAIVFTLLIMFRSTIPEPSDSDISRNRENSIVLAVPDMAAKVTVEPQSKSEQLLTPSINDGATKNSNNTVAPDKVAEVTTESQTDSEQLSSSIIIEAESTLVLDFEPKMVRIPPGKFLMGSPDTESGRNPNEGPQHEVTIAYAFEIGQTEVTFAQYDVFAKETRRPLLPSYSNQERGNHPVMRVSFNDAQAYVAWLSEKTGKNYRLPTEAEWEYMARAETSTTYWWGDYIGYNRADCRFDCGDKKTKLVRSFEPNAFIVYDTAASVWEWTQDCWHGNYQNAPFDGSAWMELHGGDCSRRVVRGGSWSSLRQDLRSASRDWGNVDEINKFDVGFRVARDL